MKGQGEWGVEKMSCAFRRVTLAEFGNETLDRNKMKSNRDTEVTRRNLLKAPTLLLASPVGAALSEKQASSSPFVLPGSANILKESDFGIVNGAITPGVPYGNVLALNGLYAPPYASSDFVLEMWLFGERVPTRGYEWFPIEVRRKGALYGIHVSSVTALAPGQRALVLAVTLQNAGKRARMIPLQFKITGSLDYVHTWDFGRPDTTKKKTEAVGSPSRVVRRNDAGAIVIETDIQNLKWEPWSSHWVTQTMLAPGVRQTYYVAVAVGDAQKSEAICDESLKQAPKVIASARQEFENRTSDLFAKLPRLEASDERLVKFYNRSLLHFLLNRWQVDQFILNPYYGTGSVLGGCLANYLWDFGEPWELFPLYDPKASREHIKQFLRIDLTAHFSFDPMTGRALGPFYPVNQEKIIGLIYYYVIETGDTAFLHETVNGRKVVDWAVYEAMWGDDPDRPVALIDYGNGNHHLELRGKYRYDYFVPDLNGRRYLNYVLASELSKLAGSDNSYLVGRAEQLKALLKKKLWSPKDRWFYLITNTGAKDLRYTVQILKLISSPVLDKEEEQGLISHLNESEFLSEWGLHSMSKKDPAYDQVDYDNGGGGCYNAFPPQIAERLYKAGYPETAADILKRILWWGERVPYWGDSFAANHIEYRRDTPLQCTFDATAAAQSIIFGMFGVKAEVDGKVRINPRPPAFSPTICLRGMKILGVQFDVAATMDGYEVTTGGKTIRSQIGVPVVLNAPLRARVQ